MRILYDGWPLVYNPISPGALQLRAILAHLPDEVSPVVALPGPAPEWLAGLAVRVHHVPNTLFGRLRWEQIYLPHLAREAGIKTLHLTSPTAPVLSDLDAILSPCGFGDADGINPEMPESHPFLARLRRSLAHGGMVRVRQILWPFDLPVPQLPGQIGWISPILPPGFDPGQVRDNNDNSLPAMHLFEQLNLPEEFIIYHGPGDRRSLEHLLQAWSWAAAAIGENYPLLLLGLNSGVVTSLSNLAQEYNLESTLRVVQDVQPDFLPHLYRRCLAVFHPAPASPWSGPVRLTLACGKPLVASENSISAAITGPAAYLAPHGDPRALGAALVTVIVERQVAERLSAAAHRRAANWEMAKFSGQLREVYSNLSQREPRFR